MNAFLEIGIDDLVGRNAAYLNCSREILMSEACLALPRHRVVLEVLEQIDVDEELLARLSLLKTHGFRIALDDFVHAPEREPLLDLADVVKIDITAYRDEQLDGVVGQLSRWDVRLLAEKVERHEQYERCRSLGFNLFQGYFLCKPKVISRDRMHASRLATLRLLARLQDPATKIEELEELISADVTLSYRILRFLNSAVFGRPTRIESVKHALVMLGVIRLRGWVSMMALADMDDKPVEILGMAAIRARMCELLAERMNAHNPESYFSVGLFSLLDGLMDTPMDKLLMQLPLSAELNRALLRREGPLGRTLSTVCRYERGDWNELDTLTLEPSTFPETYFDALQWAQELMNALGLPATT